MKLPFKSPTTVTSRGTTAAMALANSSIRASMSAAENSGTTRSPGCCACCVAHPAFTPIRFMINHCWAIERMLFQVQ